MVVHPIPHTVNYSCSEARNFQFTVQHLTTRPHAPPAALSFIQDILCTMYTRIYREKKGGTGWELAAWQVVPPCRTRLHNTSLLYIPPSIMEEEISSNSLHIIESTSEHVWSQHMLILQKCHTDFVGASAFPSTHLSTALQDTKQT